MSARLAIEIKSDAEDTLVGFPYMDGQYHDGGEDDQSEDNYWIYVELGDREDTTAMQEQFLNTNSSVISWQIL